MYKKLVVVAAIGIATQIISAQESFNENVSEVANRLSGTYQNTKQAEDPSYVLVKLKAAQS